MRDRYTVFTSHETRVEAIDMKSTHLLRTELDVPESTDSEQPAATEPGAIARFRARLLAPRLDGQIEAGAPADPGPTLAAHYHRLHSRRERLDLARSLALALRDAVEGPDALRPRTPVLRSAVLEQR